MNKEDENLEEDFPKTQEEFDDYMKKYNIKNVLYTIILLILTVVLTVGITRFVIIGKQYDELSDSTKDLGEGITSATDAIPEISKVLVAFSKVIDKEYIGEIEKEKLIDETIKGFVNGIGDEYSQYMPKSEWDEFQAEQLGNYVGIGVYLSQDDAGSSIIVSTMKDSPAEEVGLKSNDIISKIDGESFIGKTTQEVSNKVKGKEGTKLKLSVIRDNKELEFELTRRAIKVYHVNHKVLDGNIGYVSLFTFDEGCADEIKKAFDDLSKKKVKKVILDLRNNTGGYVNEALEILDMLLDDNQIELITKSADGTEKIDKAKGKKEYDFELVILANKYSASASEILIGALKENGKAKIVGTVTYGKGVIQNVYSLANGGILKLTTQEYFTPNNNKINKIGIKPDVEIDLTKEDIENQNDAQLNKAIEEIKK